MPPRTDQDHLLAPLGPGLGVLGGKDDLAAGGAGRGGQSLRHGGGFLQGLVVELGMEQGVQIAGIDHHDGILLGDHALVHQVTGDLQRGLGGALAVTGLKHIELAVLHGELHILHIAVMILQRLAHGLELGKGGGELLGHLGDGHGGTHAGHHVFALGVGEELAHQLLFAGGGVAGEGDAGAAIVAHVAEGHHLHVDGGAPAVRDVVVTAIDVGAGIIPGTEHGLNGAHELLLGVGGEVLPDLGLIFGLELHGQLLEIVGGELHILGDALSGLHLVDELLKILLAHFHDHVGIHLDKAAIAVPRPAGVARLLGDGVDHVFIEAQVEDGVHHAGHGGAGAGAHGHQKGILLVTELLAGDLFHLLDVLHDLALDLVVDPAAVFIILGAGLGADGKALRDGQADVGHLGQIGALAAQQLPHLGVAFGEQVNVLVHILLSL